MKAVDLLKFLEILKKWEEEHSGNDHGSTIVGVREKKPQFSEEKRRHERD